MDVSTKDISSVPQGVGFLLHRIGAGNVHLSDLVQALLKERSITNAEVCGRGGLDTMYDIIRGATGVVKQSRDHLPANTLHKHLKKLCRLRRHLWSIKGGRKIFRMLNDEIDVIPAPLALPRSAIRSTWRKQVSLRVLRACSLPDEVASTIADSVGEFRVLSDGLECLWYTLGAEMGTLIQWSNFSMTMTDNSFTRKCAEGWRRRWGREVHITILRLRDAMIHARGFWCISDYYYGMQHTFADGNRLPRPSVRHQPRRANGFLPREQVYVTSFVRRLGEYCDHVAKLRGTIHQEAARQKVDDAVTELRAIIASMRPRSPWTDT